MAVSIKEFYRTCTDPLVEAIGTIEALRLRGERPDWRDSPEVCFLSQFPEEELDKRLEEITDRLPKGADIMAYDDAVNHAKNVLPTPGLFAYDAAQDKMYAITSPITLRWRNV